MGDTLKVAVVGSGPAGCYLVERLVKQARDVEVDVLDRLPTPFGLVRYGVAPDHQTTKAITRVLARALGRAPAAFFGNVSLGSDINLSELRELYDAVVLATGAARDRGLGIAGEDLPGVIGSGSFVGWYNGHPDFTELEPNLSNCRRVLVIGAGNVAIDVARLLTKSAAELAQSDLDPEVAAALNAMPLEELRVVARGDAARVKFTPVELAELGDLERVDIVVDPDDLPPQGIGDEAVQSILRDFAARAPGGKPVKLHFDFNLEVESIENKKEDVTVCFGNRKHGGAVARQADLVVTCIGYEMGPLDGLAREGGHLRNDAGRIEPGLYVVGWAKRGASGTIATNRAESHAVADRLLGEVRPSGTSGREGLKALLSERGCRWVDFDSWRKIEAAETAGAGADRVRWKFRSFEALRQAAGLGAGS